MRLDIPPLFERLSSWQRRETSTRRDVNLVIDEFRRTAHGYSTITRSLPERPNVSGAYISSARAGGATKLPGVVARAT